MYLRLFDLAGLALAGWLLLILLPTWRVTRRIAETAVFPAYLAALYLAGVVPLLATLGPGILRHFGSASGVLDLLRNPDVALVAWIHILAFDHLVGVLIYRDNMRRRVVPVPVQSVILVATLMLGPIGFLAYYAVRVARRHRDPAADPNGEPGHEGAGWDPAELLDRPQAAAAEAARAGIVEHAPVLDMWREAAFDEEAESAAAAPGDQDGPASLSPGAILGAAAGRGSGEARRRRGSSVGPPEPHRVLIRAVAALAAERWLAAAGFAGVGLGLACLGAAALRGPVVPPEGRLLDAATFEVGVGVYLLTMALLLPHADFGERGRRWWRGATLFLAPYFLGIEVVQAFRGIDPRFTEFGTRADELAGGIFFLHALAVIVLFVVIALRFFRRDALAGNSPLRIAVRYGVLAVAISFGVGLAMSALSGRVVGRAGNLMLAHGMGIHGIQALPIVALMLGWAGVPRGTALRAMHLAGTAWILACAGAALQAALGRPPLEPAALPAITAVALAAWAAVAALAATAWMRARAVGTARLPRARQRERAGAP